MIENKEYTEKIRAMREINKKIGSLVSDNDELSSIFSQCVVQNGVDDVRFLHEKMAKKIMELDPELQTYALCGVLNSMDNYRDTKFGNGEYTNGDYLIHLLDNVDADKLDEFLSHVNKDGSQEFDEFLMSQLEQNDYINTVVDSLIAEKNYIEVDTIDVNGIKYVYLSNENDDKDYLILKVISDNGKEFYDKIESDEEFELVLLNFTKKHKEELKNI